MNRQIKFRGKQIDTGVWVYGFYKKLALNKVEKICYQLADYTWIDAEVIPGTVGQFTGLKDSDGREIYEGDIFTVNGKYPKSVRFIDEKASFCLANIDDLKHESWKDIWQQPSPLWWSDFKREIKVTGNVHDCKENRSIIGLVKYEDF
jgi:uncharacterized phage protein (TIGR01671 family)